MILIDYSGISIAPIAMGAVADDDLNLFRHMVLNSIRMHRNKHKAKYGEVVIVADGKGNWRRSVYPEYKGQRNKNREESRIDWESAFKMINQVYDELVEYFPYRTIKQDGCEADDSIAEIVRTTQEFGQWEDVMIISADHDFLQLQKYGNVAQYSPLTKKMLKEERPDQFLKEKILKGDNGDGVPNVMSDDRALVEGRRQNILSAKRKLALLEDPQALGEDVYRNYQRNYKMINLMDDTACPMSVREEIINNFMNQDPSANKKKVLPYLIEKDCRNLIDHVQEFI